MIHPFRRLLTEIHLCDRIEIEVEFIDGIHNRLSDSLTNAIFFRFIFHSVAAAKLFYSSCRVSKFVFLMKWINKKLFYTNDKFCHVCARLFHAL